jgi:hypothetical protein
MKSASRGMSTSPASSVIGRIFINIRISFFLRSEAGKRSEHSKYTQDSGTVPAPAKLSAHER